MNMTVEASIMRDTFKKAEAHFFVASNKKTVLCESVIGTVVFAECTRPDHANVICTALNLLVNGE